jgi:chromosomal replication initiation ATPase DnaA
MKNFPNYYLMPALKQRVYEAPGHIIEEVCTKYDLTWEQVKKKDRSLKVVFVRQLLMYLLYYQKSVS